MSDLVVQVCTVDAVLAHPNADKLELLIVNGWQVCEKKDVFKKGDKCVYFEPNTCIEDKEAERLNVASYLATGGRVKAIRLRGESSIGLVVKPDNPEWEVGKDVAEFYKVTKYVTPVKSMPGDAWNGPDWAVPYTSIQNLRHYPNLLPDVLNKSTKKWWQFYKKSADKNVVITEKIHGTNCVLYGNNGELYARSRTLCRKRPDDDKFDQSTYWFPYTHSGVLNFIRDLGAGNSVVGLACEVYGNEIQGNFAYDAGVGIGFRVFDISINGKYLDYDQFKYYTDSYGIPTVPVLYQGPFDIEKIKQYSEGSTLVGDKSPFREGVVVKPAVERTHPKIGRVILKYVSDTYLISRGLLDTTDV